jgi:hypothetical protein
MKKLIAIVLVTGTLALRSLALASVAAANGPWSLFDEAESVRDNSSPGPNPWVVQLTSEQTSEGDITFGGTDYEHPQGGSQFQDIDTLSADFRPGDGDSCGAGSPRFQLNVDTDGDGEDDGITFVYFGP